MQKPSCSLQEAGTSLNMYSLVSMPGAQQCPPKSLAQTSTQVAELRDIRQETSRTGAFIMLVTQK